VWVCLVCGLFVALVLTLVCEKVHRDGECSERPLHSPSGFAQQTTKPSLATSLLPGGVPAEGLQTTVNSCIYPSVLM
jgi:hypothetical protein